MFKKLWNGAKKAVKSVGSAIKKVAPIAKMIGGLIPGVGAAVGVASAMLGGLANKGKEVAGKVSAIGSIVNGTPSASVGSSGGGGSKPSAVNASGGLSNSNGAVVWYKQWWVWLVVGLPVLVFLGVKFLFKKKRY